MPGLPKRRHPRLSDKTIYSAPGTATHVILGTTGHKCVLSDRETAVLFRDVLIMQAVRYAVPLYAYCIMPDHIHVLAGSVEGCGIIDFVRRVKGNFAAACRRRGIGGWGLQHSFYDHVVRSNEDLLEITRYIVRNPVRKGMVETHQQYELCGSLIYPREL